MPPVINPRSEGARQAAILIAKASVGIVPDPRPGMAWGLLRARMEERVLPPGGVERTRIVWRRCDNAPCGDNACNQAGKCIAAGSVMFPCSRCWAAEKILASLIIIGPLTAVLGVECERCGGRDAEVQSYGLGGPDSETAKFLTEWQAMIDRRIERRTQCDTPFGWLPLWRPGASWQRR